MRTRERMADEKTTESKAAEKPVSIEFDLTRWDKMSYLREWNAAAQTLNFSKIYDMLAQIIVKWPYEVDPSTPKSYDDLTPAQFGEVFKAAREKIGNFFLVLVGIDQ